MQRPSLGGVINILIYSAVVSLRLRCLSHPYSLNRENDLDGLFILEILDNRRDIYMALPEKWLIWFSALRVKFFTATLVPILLGSVIAWHSTNEFNWLYFALPGQALLFIEMAGIFLAFFYSANPIRIGYTSLGELACGLGFGPIMVMGS